MNVSLIIIEGNCGGIDADYYTFRGYYIIRFSSSTYTLWADFIIDGQVIYSGEILYEGIYFIPIDINSHYYVLQKINPITQLYL